MPQGHRLCVVVAPDVGVEVIEVLGAREAVGEGLPDGEAVVDSTAVLLAVAEGVALAVLDSDPDVDALAVVVLVAHTASAVRLQPTASSPAHTAHGVQLELPPSENAPAAHVVHTATKEAPTTGLNVPAAHARQPVDLTSVLYLPAPQATQVEAPAAE